MSHTNTGDYLFDDPNKKLSLGRISLQCGRRADALKLWFCWLELGKKGLGRRVDACIDASEHLANLVEEHPQLSLVSFSYSNVCIRFTPQPNETIEQGNQRVRMVRNYLEDHAKCMILDSMLDNQLVITSIAS